MLPVTDLSSPSADTDTDSSLASVMETSTSPRSAASPTPDLDQESAESYSALKVRIKELEFQLNLTKDILESEREKAKKKKKKELVKPFWEDPIYISFPGEDYEPSSTQPHKELPKYLYRVLHEGSATLSCYMNKSCWPSDHPEYQQGNAFQSLGDFLPTKDLNVPEVLRHFRGQQKQPRTKYISFFNSYRMAVRRAKFLYRPSQRHARRISIARFNTAGLVPAFFVATEPLLSNTTSNLADQPATQQVRIPIWVSATAMPEDCSDITIQQWEYSGREMYISVYENRQSGLNLPSEWDKGMANGQPDEWLACERVPESRIEAIWPFDGSQVHLKEGGKVIVSEKNIDWEWDKASWMWRSVYEMKTIKEALERDARKKRKGLNDDLDDGAQSPKRQKAGHELVADLGTPEPFVESSSQDEETISTID